MRTGAEARRRRVKVPPRRQLPRSAQACNQGYADLDLNSLRQSRDTEVDYGIVVVPVLNLTPCSTRVSARTRTCAARPAVFPCRAFRRTSASSRFVANPGAWSRTLSPGGCKSWSAASLPWPHYSRVGACARLRAPFARVSFLEYATATANPSGACCWSFSTAAQLALPRSIALVLQTYKLHVQHGTLARSSRGPVRPQCWELSVAPAASCLRSDGRAAGQCAPVECHGAEKPSKSAAPIEARVDRD
jgi:hypothetical protein